jgi:hypothetical protein
MKSCFDPRAAVGGGVGGALAERPHAALVPAGGRAGACAAGVLAVAGIRRRSRCTLDGLDPLARAILPAVSLLFLACAAYGVPYLRLRAERSNRVFVASFWRRWG